MEMSSGASLHGVRMIQVVEHLENLFAGCASSAGTTDLYFFATLGGSCDLDGLPFLAVFTPIIKPKTQVIARVLFDAVLLIIWNALRASVEATPVELVYIRTRTRT